MDRTLGEIFAQFFSKMGTGDLSFLGVTIDKGRPLDLCSDIKRIGNRVWVDKSKNIIKGY